ncbi:acyltransferase family protein [Pseudochryseolinea flava]|nr:acyltransferase family protein [Pseudochryseolinea flava]
MNRRHDIDWVRVIAIGLLLIYHIAIGFQSWGIMIGFIANEKTWGSLWIPMSMLNIWRIPLLFFVSGMGVYFALQNRNWQQLLGERSARILLPFIFGFFVIVPLHHYVWQHHYKLTYTYTPGPDHLWFLGNIFSYVLIFTPLFYYMKKNENGKVAQAIRKTISHPLGVLVMIGAFVAEALIIKPFPYELYALTWHGYFLGLIAFFFGFCFILSGQAFWNMIVRWKWAFLSIATVLLLVRLLYFQMNVPVYLLVTESDCWILSVLAFAYRYLNKPSQALRYLSEAAYPIYIIHMIFLFLGSFLVFNLDIDVRIQFVLVSIFTFVGCFGFYEFVIRRIRLFRMLFGLKINSAKREDMAIQSNAIV